MEVYVVTNPELGWDCVCAVCLDFDSLKSFFEELTRAEEGEYDNMSYNDFVSLMGTKKEMYIIHNKYIY